MAEKLKIIPLGGLNEIGKNMTVYEYGGMINTIRCLLDMGVITEADLKTNIELYPDRYDYNYQIWGEKYGELTSFPDYGLSSSVGIIGGADGPTAVVVSGF